MSAESARIRVLFVCVENSNRSQMAEGFARSLGRGCVEAWSAGSKPAGKVNPRAIEAMRERDIDIGQQQSKGLAHLPALPFDAAVTMGCGDACPLVTASLREDWQIPDPRDASTEGLRIIRDQIERQVRDLLAKLGIQTT